MPSKPIPGRQLGKPVNKSSGGFHLLRQFSLLMWKNFILQIRRPFGTFFELLIPPLLVALLVVMRQTVSPPTDQCFVTFPSEQLNIPDVDEYIVYFAPNNLSEAVDLMNNHVAPRLSPSGGRVVGVLTEQDFIDAIENDNTNDTFGSRMYGCFPQGSAIYFDHISKSDMNISYTIRLRQESPPYDTWFTKFTVAVDSTKGARVNPNSYLNEGFMQLENVMDQAIIDYFIGLTVDFHVDMKAFPYPSYKKDRFLTAVNFLLPLFLVLSLMYSAGTLTKELVVEKETRMRETMKMMGLSQWVLWLTWFIKQLIFFFFPVVAITLLLKYGGVFSTSDGFILFLFMSFFMVSTVSFSFLMSVLFNSARIALLASFIIFVLAFIPYFFISIRYDDLYLYEKLLGCVLSNTAVGLGVQVFSSLELRGDGVTFDNLFSVISLDDSFSLAYVFLFLFVDSVLYMIIAWYVDAVFPGEYGIPKPPYFLFMKSYWTGKPWKRETQLPEELVESPAPPADPTAHQEEPPNRDVGISINNLSKIFHKNRPSKRKVAVDQLNLNIYRGQITALLGHNGAGKTTTMSMLTGLFTPTSGTAYINGRSILWDMEQIRQRLGICPQHNVLFDRMRVDEHLQFFARLKGMPERLIFQEVRKMLKDLHLEDKEKTLVKDLSGGMKRKLSVGIALIGGSTIVILDEPTSGMDPYARRATWDMLVNYKKGRTILLTTHFMDEADLLGDRIAIMAEGKLVCSGSSLFLKSRYGIGYHMTVVKEPGCNSQILSGVVEKMVEGAKEVTDVGAELTFILPTESSQQFSQLFDTLEARKEDLGISSFGVSVTTMEEVFIKVGQGTDETLEARLRQRKASAAIGTSMHSRSPPALEETHPGEDETGFARTIQDDDDEDLDSGDAAQLLDRKSGSSKKTYGGTSAASLKGELSGAVNTGWRLWIQQFWAIFLKRFYNSLRFWSGVIWQLVIPLLFTLLALVLGVTVPGRNSDDPKRELSLTNSAGSDNITIFWANFSTLNNDTALNRLQLDDGTLLEDLGVTLYTGINSDVKDIINGVNEMIYTGTGGHADCCAYTHQLLDNYCASLSVGNFSALGNCTENSDAYPDFGYKDCTDCLGCCRATLEAPPTCSNPALQLSTIQRPTGPKSKLLCPYPPPIPFTTQSDAPLTDMNVFVDEHLLNVSIELSPPTFFNRYVAGFVVHNYESPMSTCGCVNDTETCSNTLDLALEDFVVPLSLPQSGGLSLYCNQIKRAGFIPPNSNPSCPATDEGEAWNTEYNGIVQACIDVLACNSSSDDDYSYCTCQNDDECLVGRTTVPQPSSPNVTATIFYNNQPFHMIAASLNTFYTFYLRQQVPNGNPTIVVYNQPLPRNITTQIDDAETQQIGFIIGTISALGLTFLLSSFIVFLVQEIDSGAKHLQFVSGVQISSYWLATLAWDMFNCIIPVVCTFILFACFQLDGFTGENLGAVLLSLFLTCWCSVPLTYCFSFLFTNALVAFAIMSVILYFVSLAFQATVILLNSDYPDTADTLHYCFLLHPLYGYATALANMYSNQQIKDACTQNSLAEYQCEDENLEYADSIFEFLTPGIGHIFLYQFCEGIIFFILTLLIERKMFLVEFVEWLSYRRKKRPGAETLENGDSEPSEEEEDEDVAAERKRVKQMMAEALEKLADKTVGESLTEEEQSKEVVVLQGLTKEYRDYLGYIFFPFERCRKSWKLAANDLYLTIPRGECFGLLGVNGAGKTTTFKMLSGDIHPTAGTSLVAGFDIRRQLRQVQQRIGYCPQFDALIDRLTGRELLTMFARLRGIPEKEVKAVVEQEINRLDLKKHANKLCGNYSGGNRRKLSTAIALVGRPPILLLDEPTTGMDPATRRFLWDALTNVIKQGQSVILTSHSMEECEALCTRLAIMVNGTFRCLGSIQHLKSRFGSGFMLQIKIKAQLKQAQPGKDQQDVMVYDTSAAKSFISGTFPGSVILEQHQGALTYRIPSKRLTWSMLFKHIEANKERLGIVDYAVSQTTLEQVFIRFAQDQDT